MKFTTIAYATALTIVSVQAAPATLDNAGLVTDRLCAESPKDCDNIKRAVAAINTFNPRSDINTFQDFCADHADSCESLNNAAVHVRRAQVEAVDMHNYCTVEDCHVEKRDMTAHLAAYKRFCDTKEMGCSAHARAAEAIGAAAEHADSWINYAKRITSTNEVETLPIDSPSGPHFFARISKRDLATHCGVGGVVHGKSGPNKFWCDCPSWIAVGCAHEGVVKRDLSQEHRAAAADAKREAAAWANFCFHANEPCGNAY